MKQDPTSPNFGWTPWLHAAAWSPSAYGAMPGAMPMATVRPRMAGAHIRGGPLAPDIRGVVQFREVAGGTWVSVAVEGLPPYRPAAAGGQPVGPHGFHLHQNGSCDVGDPGTPFQGAGEHWNPDNQPHGNHAGDFPALFSNGGRAVMTFFTDRFRPADVIGKAVIIHENPDDYRSQPAGNSGRRLACGVIAPQPPARGYPTWW